MTSHNRKCRRLYIEKTNTYKATDDSVLSVFNPYEVTSRLSLYINSNNLKIITCDKTIYSNGQRHESSIKIDTCTKLRKFTYYTEFRKTITRSCK